ncbi:MAG: GNAT family N-acetyltransferase [Anaerolineaceae bacterium]|nr:GNAT family N-acetyltransferase [Anaerolineaceae bacterium]
MEEKIRPPERMDTDRLWLRPVVVGDAETIYETYAHDLEVTRFATWVPHASVVETQRYLQACETGWREGTAFPWALIRKADDRLIGSAELRIDQYKAEIGYLIARPLWGKGYATEAARVLVDWAYAHPDIYRVWATCDAGNLASARVLEKAGLVFEGRIRRWLRRPGYKGVPRDVLFYAKVK